MTTTAGTTGNTGISNIPGVTSTGSTQSQNIAPWAQQYVGCLLGKTQALTSLPMQVYQGNLTAGPSCIQKNLFSGIGQLGLPSAYGQTWSQSGIPTAPAQQNQSETSLVSQAAAGQPFTQPTGAAAIGGTGFQGCPNSVAAQYMNPYLSQALAPALNCLAYTAQKDEQGMLGNLTKQGAYGGCRQAVAQGIAEGNLLASQNKLIGCGYANAYNTGLSAFNTAQQNANAQLKTALCAGATQQGIACKAAQANYQQFLTQQQYPYQQLTYAKGMLCGLPLKQCQTTPNAMSCLGTLLTALGVYSNPCIQKSLQSLGSIFSSNGAGGGSVVCYNGQGAINRGDKA